MLVLVGGRRGEMQMTGMTCRGCNGDYHGVDNGIITVIMMAIMVTAAMMTLMTMIMMMMLMLTMIVMMMVARGWPSGC